jgi:hypothetical protein
VLKIEPRQRIEFLASQLRKVGIRDLDQLSPAEHHDGRVIISSASEIKRRSAARLAYAEQAKKEDAIQHKDQLRTCLHCRAVTSTARLTLAPDLGSSRAVPIWCVWTLWVPRTLSPA